MANLTIYDMATDDFRPVTQADIDELVAFRAAYGQLRTRIAEVHGQLVGVVTKAQSEGVREGTVTN